MKKQLKRFRKWMARLLKPAEGQTQEQAGISPESKKLLPPGPATSQPKGLHCPNCQTPIPVSIPILLSGEPLMCPHCNMVLNLDLNKSKGALEALKKLDDGMKKAEGMVGGS